MSPSSENSKTPHILLIEDNAEFQELVQEALSFSDYEVTPAQSGSAALDILRQLEPDLIICDFHLQDMTACDLLAVLGSMAQVPQMPVIIMSGERNPQELCPQPGLQIDAFLVKPFTIAELKKTVAHALLTKTRTR